MKKIKKSVIETLKKAYPDVKIYGNDTKEGYKKPCFFVYVTQTFSESTKNLVHKNMEVEIQYIQKSPNESESMDFFATMQEIFLQKLQVGDRFLNISDHYSEFDGDFMEIPIFGFNLEYWEAIKKVEEDIEMMGELKLNPDVKEV